MKWWEFLTDFWEEEKTFVARFVGKPGRCLQKLTKNGELLYRFLDQICHLDSAQPVIVCIVKVVQRWEKAVSSICAQSVINSLY